jgi:glyoxylase-like metal-dependent hydrolase (beta-lactamase superfamily II)
MKHAIGVMALAAALACAQVAPERRIIDDSVAALGGRAKIESVTTLTLEGEGENYNLGQNSSPEADLPVYKVGGFKRTIDLAGDRWRQEQLRTPQFPTGNPAAVRQVTGFDGGLAYNVAPDGTATRAPENAARDRRVEHWLLPVTALRAALAPTAQLSNVRTLDNQNIVDLKTAGGDLLTLAIDSTSKLPTKITAMTYHPNLGDVALEARFGNYQDVDGLKLPADITWRLDNYTVARITLTKQTINAPVDDLAAPAVVKTASTQPPAPNVTVEPIAPGIWYLAGQSHHSVLVEFSDHLTLIEAPQSEARTLAVLAKVKELSPKPLTQVVATHHHFDHSGGIRAAVSAGLAVVAHKATQGFFEDLVSRKHTIVADTLSKSPAVLKFEGVGDELVLKDTTRTVALYPIAGSPHGETLLMVYFPKERLLVEADVYSPPAPNAPAPPAFPFAANLVDNLRKRSVKVDRVVPIHGRIVPFVDLLTASGWKPTPTE